MKAYAKSGLEIFAVLIVALAPFFIASRIWWAGIATVAIFTLFVAVFATATLGPEVGIRFLLAFVVIGTVAIAVSGSPLLAALLVAACAYAIAMCALRGLTTAMLQIAIFVPYLIHASPAPPPGGSRDAAYFIAVAVTILLAGTWGTAIAWLVLRNKPLPKRPAIPSRHDAVLAGGIVAVVTGLITYVALSRAASTEWVWILLTIFILTKPTPGLNWSRAQSRVLGTGIGVAVAALVGVLGLPTLVLNLLGALTMTAALTLQLKGQPYWIYASLLTPAVILVDSAANDTGELALQRFVFTVIGAVFAIALAAAINAFVITKDEEDTDTAPGATVSPS
ncbi:MAG: FUSC family protein [Candidatus Nanopelagicales bacterium]